MSEDDTAGKQAEGEHEPTGFKPGPASVAVVSLSQAILAPLDALAKAQVHAARSFLNFVLQLGYPHAPVDKNNTPIPSEDDTCYTHTFRFAMNEGNGGQETKKTLDVTLPVLSLIPIQPIGIESADFSIELIVKEVAHHRQIQRAEEKVLIKEKENLESEGALDTSELKDRPHPPRPWYLVSDPISVRGNLSDHSEGQSSIKINVKVARSPTPAGLEKLFSAMTQSAMINEMAKKSEPSQH